VILSQQNRHSPYQFEMEPMRHHIANNTMMLTGLLLLVSDERVSERERERERLDWTLVLFCFVFICVLLTFS
jgi:hypothetical protein